MLIRLDGMVLLGGNSIFYACPTFPCWVVTLAHSFPCLSYPITSGWLKSVSELFPAAMVPYLILWFPLFQENVFASNQSFPSLLIMGTTAMLTKIVASVTFFSREWFNKHLSWACFGLNFGPRSKGLWWTCWFRSVFFKELQLGRECVESFG